MSCTWQFLLIKTKLGHFILSSFDKVICCSKTHQLIIVAKVPSYVLYRTTYKTHLNIPVVKSPFCLIFKSKYFLK